MSKKKNKNQTKELPLVSVCTPTFNRRPFIPYMIRCFENQTYPKDKLEWIIIDDGTDKIEDLVQHIPQVKYFKFDTKMPLGKKRNLMHKKSTGSIIVYMDDDDYYPPERVMHAVERLQSNPKALCAGSSEMYIYFKHVHKMYQFGPYGPTHATAGTFAFKRELLSRTSYEEGACLAEEKHFLKDYTIPFVQLDPLKTILVFSHNHNTFDKKILLNNINQYIKESNKTVDNFVKEGDIKEFFLNSIDKLLEAYDPGKIENKPDVLRQMEEINKKRNEIAESMQLKQQIMNMSNYEQIVRTQNETIVKLNEKVAYLEGKIKELIQDKINTIKANKI
jgi:glycosyltransferase involved in cell wall biosynthesis